MPFGWDGRNPTLEAQAKNSVATGAMSMRETGNPVKVEVIEQRIRDVPEYVERFKAALPGAAITIDTIAQAIAAYERTMEPGPRAVRSLDRGRRGRDLRMRPSAASCCSTPRRPASPATPAGASPTTSFTTSASPRPIAAAAAALKDDEAMQYAFKTPTLRSVALRPPYMHDGSSATLSDVVKHYEKEPIDRPSRSPLFVPVELTEQERLDLVAFMQTLTGSPEGEPAPELPRRRE